MNKDIHYSIKVLPAECGDCIFISIYDCSEKFNILIDGGTTNTYVDYRERPNEYRALYHLIQDLKSNERHIDLLILSHVDDDHVGGLIEWFNDDFPTNDFVKCFWINDSENSKQSIRIIREKSLKDSITSTATLIETLQENSFHYCNHVFLGMQPLVHRLFTIKVLSPLEKYHDRIADRIADSLKDSAVVFNKNSIKDIINSKWVYSKQTSDNNRASIAIQIEVANGDNLLFMGDGHINDIVKGIKQNNSLEKGVLQYKWVKLSHHGSKYNFHPELLKIIDAENYIVSTDGSINEHPDKEVLAYIIDKTNSNIYFNYKDIIKDKLFVPRDYSDYPSLDGRLKSTLDEIVSNTDSESYPNLVEHIKTCYYDN